MVTVLVMATVEVKLLKAVEMVKVFACAMAIDMSKVLVTVLVKQMGMVMVRARGGDSK